MHGHTTDVRCPVTAYRMPWCAALDTAPRQGIRRAASPLRPAAMARRRESNPQLTRDEGLPCHWAAPCGTNLSSP